ncbi:hypothetical protein G7Y41_07140 [Schaalia sp. ZJ405]|uniref:hypothetical protein n=1 Tax=Schaalia sp. ZJ405 TaxID=2709403 RepID=UPI0013EBFC7B|nr:hypothetical protein [Schaalia sp. ZJ405]QPK80828.1 hypothetical protein G7Y41_07140 [Schaalia sp. ZJ405]
MLGIDFDPLITSGAVGVLATVLQAVFDQPRFTATHRRLIALGLGLVLSVVIWWAGAYPASWQLIATQASVVIASAAAAFTILKQVGVIDWIGHVTPGGEAYTPKHREGDAD